MAETAPKNEAPKDGLYHKLVSGIREEVKAHPKHKDVEKFSKNLGGKTLEIAGLNPEKAQAVRQHDERMLAGVAGAAQQKALEDFRKDPELKQVSMETHFLNDRVQVRVDRMSRVPNPSGKVTEEPGTITLKYEVSGKNKDADPVKSIRKQFHKAAKAL